MFLQHNPPDRRDGHSHADAGVSFDNDFWRRELFLDIDRMDPAVMLDHDIVFNGNHLKILELERRLDDDRFAARSKLAANKGAEQPDLDALPDVVQPLANVLCGQGSAGQPARIDLSRW